MGRGRVRGPGGVRCPLSDPVAEERTGRPQRGADRVLVLQPRRRDDQPDLCNPYAGLAAGDGPVPAAADLCPQYLDDLPGPTARFELVADREGFEPSNGY